MRKIPKLTVAEALGFGPRGRKFRKRTARGGRRRCSATTARRAVAAAASDVARPRVAHDRRSSALYGGARRCDAGADRMEWEAAGLIALAAARGSPFARSRGDSASTSARRTTRASRRWPEKLTACARTPHTFATIFADSACPSTTSRCSSSTAAGRAAGAGRHRSRQPRRGPDDDQAHRRRHPRGDRTRRSRRHSPADGGPVRRRWRRCAVAELMTARRRSANNAGPSATRKQTDGPVDTACPAASRSSVARSIRKLSIPQSDGPGFKPCSRGRDAVTPRVPSVEQLARLREVFARRRPTSLADFAAAASLAGVTEAAARRAWSAWRGRRGDGAARARAPCERVAACRHHRRCSRRSRRARRGGAGPRAGDTARSTRADRRAPLVARLDGANARRRRAGARTRVVAHARRDVPAAMSSA